jgi:outer membrane biosynthesis protein TonB
VAKNTISVGTHAENPQAAETSAPEVKAPKAPVAKTPAPKAKAPEAPAAEKPAPEVKASEAPAAETPAPEAKAPEAPAAETPAPEAKATEAPAAGKKAKPKYSDAVTKRAIEVFKHHPTIDTIFFTSDGTAFLGAQFARIHAESLKDSVVTTVTRKEIE